MMLQLEQGHSRANAQALVCCSSRQKDRQRTISCPKPWFLFMSVVSVSKSKIRMSAQLWQPDLKRSFERKTTLVSRNSLLVRLHSWNWECRTTQRASSTVPWGNWWTTGTRESFGKASEEEKQGPGTMWPKQCPAWMTLLELASSW